LRKEHSENRVLRRIFGPKMEEDGLWRKLHNDELHSLYSSPNIVRVIKSRRMRWTGHVACMGEGRGQGPVGGFCEHADEPSGSIKKAGYFLISLVTISFSNNILHHGVSK
jgi:hypothetical protein